MELDIIKQQTTWNDAANSINVNFSKIKQALALLEGADAGLNEEELIKFLEENGYATDAYVAAQISSIIGGADSDYDNLLKIQQILQGNEIDLESLKEKVDNIETDNGMFSWLDEEHTAIVAESSLIVKGDISDEGMGEAVVGVTGILVNGEVYYGEDGIIDLSAAIGNNNNDADLSDKANGAYALLNYNDEEVIYIDGDSIFHVGDIVPEYNYEYYIGTDERYYKCVSSNVFFAGSTRNNLWLLAGSYDGMKIIFGSADSCETSFEDRTRFAELGGEGLLLNVDLILGDTIISEEGNTISIEGSLIVEGDVASTGSSEGGSAIIPDLEGYATIDYVDSNFLPATYNSYSNWYEIDANIYVGENLYAFNMDTDYLYSYGDFWAEGNIGTDGNLEVSGDADFHGDVYMSADYALYYAQGVRIYGNQGGLNLDAGQDNIFFHSYVEAYNGMSVWCDGEEVVSVGVDGLFVTGEITASAGAYIEGDLSVADGDIYFDQDMGIHFHQSTYVYSTQDGLWIDINQGDLRVNAEIISPTISDILDRLDALEGNK